MKLNRITGKVPKTHIEAIERYIQHGDIALTDDQKELMLRIQYADEKKRSRILDREEIIKLLMARFGISKWRAEQDITDAHRLFGTTRKLNKNYLLAQHIENIEKQIATFEKAHQYSLIPKLNDNYTYALNSLQQDQAEHEVSPTTIIFVVKAPSDEKKKTVEELLAEADKLLKKSTNQNDYIEYEESK